MKRITVDECFGKMKLLIYGDAGSGKTHLSGTAQKHPLMKDVCVFNIDGGISTLIGTDIFSVDIKNCDDLESELLKIASNHEDYKTIKTIVVDNISELQQLNLESIVQGEFQSRFKKNKDTNPDDIYLEDFSRSTKQLSRIFRQLRNLPLNVIYIAHRKDKLRKGTSVVEESKPLLTDKLCSILMGYVDFIWYLYTEETEKGVERRLLTQPINNFIAKTRGVEFAESIGVVVPNPKLDVLFENYIKIYKKGENK